MRFTVVVNPYVDLFSGEKVIEGDINDLSEKLPPEAYNKLCDLYEVIKSNPELKIIYSLEHGIIFGGMFRVMGTTFFAFTTDRSLYKRCIGRKIRIVKVSLDDFQNIMEGKHYLEIPYLTKVMFLNDVERSFFKLLIFFMNNCEIEDIITEDNFRNYEAMFEISEINPDEYGKVAFIYTYDIVSVYVMSHFSDLTPVQRQVMENIVEKLFVKLAMIYSTYDATPENLVNIYNDFIYSTKRVDNTVVRRPFLIFLRFKREYYEKLKQLIIEKAISVDDKIKEELVEKYSKLYREIPAITPESILVKLLNMSSAGRKFLIDKNVKSDWLVIFEEKNKYTFEEILYARRKYHIGHLRDYTIKQIVEEVKPLAFIPLTRKEDTIQFIDLELIFSFYTDLL